VYDVYDVHDPAGLAAVVVVAAEQADQEHDHQARHGEPDLCALTYAPPPFCHGGRADSSGDHPTGGLFGGGAVP
jgi:hypothetical protein